MHSTACCEGIFRSQPGRHGSQPGRSSASERSPLTVSEQRSSTSSPTPPDPAAVVAGSSPTARTVGRAGRAKPPSSSLAAGVAGPVPSARAPWVMWRVGLTADCFSTTGPAGSVQQSLLSRASAGPLAGVLDRRSLPTEQTQWPVGWGHAVGDSCMASATACGSPAGLTRTRRTASGP